MHPVFLGHWFDASNPYAPLNWYNAIGAVGCVLWIAAYVLIIRQAHRDGAYGMPMLALCLNITWEGVAFLSPNPVPLWKWIEGLWLGIDAVLLWQLIRYGRTSALPPTLKPWFFPLLIGTLTVCALGHWTWQRFWDDKLLFVDAFIINLVMSVLFIHLWLSRLPDARGLSLSAAWCKMLGTALTSIQCGVFLPKTMGDQPFRDSWAFMWLLYGTIFVIDAVYVALLIHGRRRIATT
jgi:hypothetical protein